MFSSSLLWMMLEPETKAEPKQSPSTEWTEPSDLYPAQALVGTRQVKGLLQEAFLGCPHLDRSPVVHSCSCLLTSQLVWPVVSGCSFS